MKTDLLLLLLFVDVFVRCSIVIWMMYLTAIHTTLFEETIIRIIVSLSFIIWVVVPPVENYIRDVREINK